MSPRSPIRSQDVRNLGLFNGEPAVLIIINKQPNANIIETIDRIMALLPQLARLDSRPTSRSTSRSIARRTIRASLHDVERTLIISVLLVILVVFVFLRNWRATLIPAVAVPVSLIGTFSIMYLAGFSLDNLSLMALTVATGFVVDDAVVVLENISRHMEAGMPRMQARAARRARGRLHRAVDEPVADRRVHPDPADGRHRRALFPRILDHAVGRDPRVAGWCR